MIKLEEPQRLRLKGGQRCLVPVLLAKFMRRLIVQHSAIEFFKMVTKSKLKMALLGEKGVDFKKEKQKKLAKKARREKMKKCDKLADGLLDTDEKDEKSEEEEAESEDGGVALDQDGEGNGDDVTAKVSYDLFLI
jgi:hypothetical protein